MIAKPFIDTNVLVYAYSLDDGRNERAAALIAAGGVVSVQVLNEFVNVARRKLCFDWDKIVWALDDLTTLLDAPMPLTMEVHRGGIDIARRFGFRIYDSLILSTARLAGSRVVYTEDLQDGQMIDGVLVRNPFADL